MRVDTVETKVYKFAELSDEAKNKARDWFREGALDYDWFDSVYEDAKSIGLKITSFDLGRSQDIQGHLDSKHNPSPIHTNSHNLFSRIGIASAMADLIARKILRKNSAAHCWKNTGIC